ncbi:TetR/AcrR family transcriptional regulator (plasmid) [Curtobacterium sp. TC1]|jgi:AcrR family transcriptional regulator|uniref:TetR/AcrR family transcriptional regulator n=1 Tax=Curtobacterium sp. TC1 TaxID=2862880 RepID=UPI001C9B9EAE|nr:TetR/AcrR family transcriptional regulator [Curtobacterium sp. TC1]QZQ53626.1 TetR/AcrR family transcriptional regulator [Curtobacterium sp. TC1]
MSNVQQRPLRRRFETRRRLLSAAAELFDEQGTIRQSVETICTRAGYTRGAFYSNFGSVDDLYLALHHEQAAGVWERLLIALDSQIDNATRGDALEDGVERLLEALPPERKWYALRAVLLARASADSAFAQSLQLDENPFVAELGGRFEDLVAAYGRKPIVDVALFAKAIVAAHTGAVSEAAIDGQASRTQLVVVTGIIRGLTVEVGTT